MRESRWQDLSCYVDRMAEEDRRWQESPGRAHAAVIAYAHELIETKRPERLRLAHIAWARHERLWRRALAFMPKIRREEIIADAKCRYFANLDLPLSEGVSCGDGEAGPLR